MSNYVEFIKFYKLFSKAKYYLKHNFTLGRFVSIFCKLNLKISNMQLFPLRLIGDNTNFRFYAMSKYSYALSIIASLICFVLLFTKGLNFGIDFTGGIVIEARSTQSEDLGSFRKILSNMNIGDVAINSFGTDGDIMIKVGGDLNETEISSIVKSIKFELEAKIDKNIEFRKTDFVGPQVGSQLIFSGAQALILAFVAIMVYVWFRFEWQFGLGVLIALVHNIILSIGFLSLSQLDFNLSTIAGLLTIIGYSVNDSVVIYDRIRENLRKFKNKTIQDIIDKSVNETLSRTTLTVMTTLIANLALIIWGGDEISSFSMLVFFGITVGTYSSIFISAPILKSFGLDKLQNSTVL